ncbi:hypothetical protein B0H13DRAFT_125168 [Mycena leptocephala]|nr:hypothetical protein B0H13DRAFT_125168 [Mycena leptocephala]
MNTRATLAQYCFARRREKRASTRRILKVREHPRNQTRNTLVHGRVRSYRSGTKLEVEQGRTSKLELGWNQKEYDKKCLVLLFPGVCLPNVGITLFSLRSTVEGRRLGDEGRPDPLVVNLSLFTAHDLATKIAAMTRMPRFPVMPRSYQKPRTT